MNQKQFNNNPILQNVVNRCHVGATYGEVFSYAVSRLSEGVWDKMDPKDKERFRKACIYLHDKSRSLYNHVMRGI